MLEQVIDYPNALSVPTELSEPAGARDARAIAWIKQQTGGPLVVVTPRKQNHGYSQEMQRFLKTPGIRQESAKGLSGGSLVGCRVLLAWPTLKMLQEVAIPGLSALAVIEWNETEINAWARAVDPVILGGNRQYSPANLSDPIVRELFLHMGGINLGHSWLDSDERDEVVSGIKMMKKHGHQLDPDDIYAFLIGQGWDALLAGEVSTLIKEANAGKNHRIKNKAYDRDYYEHLVKEASDREEQNTISSPRANSL